MSVPDPRQAPPRGDLPFLRRRSRRQARLATPDRESTAGSPSSVLADFIAGRTTHAHPTPRPEDPPPAAPSGPSGASEATSLDLSATPTRASPAAAQPAASAASLDLSEPETQPGNPGRPAKTARAAPSTRDDRRVRGAEQVILTSQAPTVTLSRVQSGVGALFFEAVCSAEIGDLRLGAAYQLASGSSSTVQHSGGNRFAPPLSRRPVIVAGHEEYEQLGVDLRQCRELERMAVFAFSGGGSKLTWGGTLIVTTFGGARLELPLDSLPAAEVAVLTSVYNICGEIVLRAELESISGSIREAARAYGYDKITWLDERRPVE
jgi:uncharacterized protein involved in tellurium resistance